MHHFRNNYQNYLRRNDEDAATGVGCSLCETLDLNQIIEESETMRVVKNRVPYDMFDGLLTTGEHYMIIPKRHLSLLQDFTDTEMLDMMHLAATYEQKGFSVYARSHTNIHRSQTHQHTHLIKLGDVQPKAVLYHEKPYILAVSRSHLEKSSKHKRP